MFSFGSSQDHIRNNLLFVVPVYQRLAMGTMVYLPGLHSDAKLVPNMAKFNSYQQWGSGRCPLWNPWSLDWVPNTGKCVLFLKFVLVFL